MPSVGKIRAGFHSGTEFVAGRAVACDSQVIVPVLRIAARIAGANPAADSSAPSGLGGSCSTDLVGAWIRGNDGRTQWLASEPTPPENAADWSQWLSGKPELQTEIEDAARQAQSTD